MKQNNTISFVIFKSASGKSHSFTISIAKLNVILFSLVFGIIALIGGIYLSYNTNLKQAAYAQLKKTTLQQEEYLKALSEDLYSIKNNLENLIEKEEELEQLLGEAKLSKKKLKNRKLKAFKKAFDTLESSEENPFVSSQKVAEFLSSYLSTYDQKYAIHLDRTHRIKARFELTPSIRPLYGRIMSRYGWRRHPITGRRRFHKGIDIAAWTGAPIHVTADGVVEYAGWSRTFGYVVVVDHNYGYRTIYAHCSQILVSKRDFVRKGQVVAQVGSTGLSTGPHLHYEIRKWQQSLNPVAYMDLDMFTARNRIW